MIGTVLVTVVLMMKTIPGSTANLEIADISGRPLFYQVVQAPGMWVSLMVESKAATSATSSAAAIMSVV